MVRGGRGRHFFFEILNYFYRILRKIKSIYIAGKRSGHPFLNFLDPPMLMFAITYTGIKFNFFKQGPAYKKEGPDPNKGSNQQ